MQAYLNGDLEAFEKLYARHSEHVYAYLKKRLSQKEEQDEVFQKVFFKFHQARAKFDFRYTVLQWLFVITKTSLVDHIRSKGRQETLLESLRAEPAEFSEATKTAELIGQLDGKQREIVQMRAVGNLTYAEIAKKLGSTEVSIRKNFSRAVRKLRALIVEAEERSS